MNLYIFNQTRRGSVFGVGTYIRELTAALEGRGVTICVINLLGENSQIQTEQLGEINYWSIPLAISDQRTTSVQKQWELYYRNVVYLLQLKINDKQNLIFHMNFFENGELVDALKKAFDCRIVAVNHFFNWSFTIFDNPQRFNRIIKDEHTDSLEKKLKKSFIEEKAYYSKVDHIICLSNYMKEILCRDYEIDISKISVIPNGLCDVFDTSDNIKQIRKKWNIPYDERIILFAGRIDDVKGVIYLIRAFREVLKKNSNCRLIMAGSGDYDKCFHESTDICTRITFTGLLDKQLLYELYKLADVGVVPSLFEPFGYVAVEMMMHGLPIVFTETSGLNEVVDEACGLKVPIKILSDRVEIDTNILSEKILYLLQHPTEAKLIGENGRKRYLDNYSSKIFCDNMSQVYKLICK